MQWEYTCEDRAALDDEDSERIIRLRSFGERWDQLVLTLAGHVRDRGSMLGLHVLAS